MERIHSLDGHKYFLVSLEIGYMDTESERMQKDTLSKLEIITLWK